MVDVSLFTDEVIDLARQTYDDIFQLIGVHGTAQRSTWDAFKDRFPWLLCNIGGGLLAAVIASRFEHLLQEVVVLALFIPIVLALGESVSMQALSLTLQSFTDGPFVGAAGRAMEGVPNGRPAGHGMRRRGRGGRDRVARRNGGRGLVFCRDRIVDAGGVPARGGVPAVLRLVKADPRIAAGPVVLAAADVTTLFFYFGLGARFLG